MIRAAGILAIVASLVLFGVLLRSVHSAEASATVVPDLGVNLRSSSTPELTAVYLQFEATPDNDALQRFVESGIRVAGIFDAATNWGVLMPSEITAELEPGDRIVIRSKRIRLGVGEYVRDWTWLRCEVRRGARALFFDGPGNRKFLLVFGAVAGGPVVLWMLAAGIVGLATLRRGPLTTPPGSPGTPGSP